MADSGYIFTLASDNAEVITEAVLKTNYYSVRLIKDSGVVNPLQPSYLTNILLCGNCVDPAKRNLYVFYIDTFFHSAWIIEINVDTRIQKVVYFDKDNNIGFDPLHKIYNARVAFGRLIWTDNVNPIYQMDIERAKNSFLYQIGYGGYPNTSEWNSLVSYGEGEIVSNGNYFYKSTIDGNIGSEPSFDDGTLWTKLCLIEDAYYSMNVKNFYFEPIPPKHPPIVEYRSDAGRQINNLRQTLFQFAYLYVYMDWRKSTLSPASILPMPNSEEESATGLANEQISLNNSLKITVNSGGEEVRQIEIVARSSNDPSKWFLIETINMFDEQERGGETSKTTNAPVINLTITLPPPNTLNGMAINPGDIGLGMTIPSPTVTNAYLEVSNASMSWTDLEQDFVDRRETTVTVHGIASCILLSFPSWITIVELPFPHGALSLGATIPDGQALAVYPTNVNTGARLTGTIIFRDAYGDTVSITVEQSAPLINPTVTIESGNPGRMTLTNTLGEAILDSASLRITFTPDDIRYGDLIRFDLPYEIYKNGVAAGTGTLLNVRNRTQNIRTIIMTSTAQAADNITVYLAQLA
jgi:hypothetical protein